MSTEQEKYHLIDRYLRGELTGRELEDFTKNLSDDPGFAEDVAFQSEVNELVSVNAYNELRNQMSADIASIDKGASSKGFNKTISVILIAGLLSVAGGYFLLKDKNKANAELAVNDTKEVTQPSNAPGPELLDNVVNDGAQKQGQSEFVGKKINKASESNTKDKNVEIQSNTEPLNQVWADTAIIENQSTTGNENDRTIVKEPVSNTFVKPEIKTDPCSKAVIKVNWSTSEACQARNDGRIEIDEGSIQGGEAPYKFEFYSGNQKVDLSDLDQLYSGNYTLKVVDVNGCLGKWNIKLSEKNCQPAGVSFSPAQGETWAFNGNDRNSYYLSIYNQAGQMVFKSGLLSGVYEWSGISNSGSTVETGFYVYVAEYTNGKKENGQITVIR
ncbi:MAG: gliding motility-associated C-terminal domain-containing protein [Sporocytophaga sp.]|nr:gliding motility-associated C-terminal domain-containing protein [Sporocytophaga sp.]